MTTAYFVVSLISLISMNEVDFNDNVSHSRDSRACVFIFMFNYRINRPIVAVDVRF